MRLISVLFILFVLSCAAVEGVWLKGHIVHEVRKGRIGITWNSQSRRIVRIHKNSPAERAGLIKGDKVLEYHDKDIKGESYTSVELIILRGTERMRFLIIRVPWEYIK